MGYVDLVVYGLCVYACVLAMWVGVEGMLVLRGLVGGALCP